MFIIICYDIANDRRRYRIEKTIRNVGYRVQESVFECNISEKQFLNIKKQIEKYMSLEHDNVRYYFLCKNCINAVEVSGIGIPPDDEKELTIVI